MLVKLRATQCCIALNMIIEKVMDELLSEGLDKEELKADVDALLYVAV